MDLLYLDLQRLMLGISENKQGDNPSNDVENYQVMKVIPWQTRANLHSLVVLADKKEKHICTGDGCISLP